MSKSINSIKSVIRVVALALELKGEKKYLLAQRSQKSSGAGQWEFPGGKVESNETDYQALIREIKEELNFDLSNMSLRFVGDHLHDYGEKKIHIWLYASEVLSKPTFTLSDHDQIGWYTPSEMHKVSLSSGDKHFISLLK